MQARARIRGSIVTPANGIRECVVKLRYKILSGVGAVLLLGIATLMIATSYDSPCPAPSATVAGADTMRAVMHRCYGVPGGISVENIARPVPGDGQMLIKVRASSVNPAEWYGISGQPYLIRLDSGIGAPERSRVGFDMAGVVEAVGPNVTTFKPGDEVFGGVGGALAEYVIAREKGAVVHKPASLSFEEAAGIPIAAITALQGLRDHGHLAAGQKVLINGASGGVGSYAVQIAKALGAEVTGVCSTRNVELVRSLGADHVVDYTKGNFIDGTTQYDVILDNVGNHSYFDLAAVTRPAGIIVTVGGSKKNPWLGPIWRITWRLAVSPFIDQELPFFIAKVNKADLEWLAGLASEGKLKTAIDRRYPLEKTGEALEYIGSQRARAKVIITVN
jgi:NADPH:quinone reductase-like Zn-dependent oxidoreductase